MKISKVPRELAGRNTVPVSTAFSGGAKHRHIFALASSNANLAQQSAHLSEDLPKTIRKKLGEHSMHRRGRVSCPNPNFFVQGRPPTAPSVQTPGATTPF